MAHYGDHPRLTRSSEPIDASVWHWFVCNGPHGDAFTWHREHGRSGVDLLTRSIYERESTQPGFQERARLTALEALKADDAMLVLKGIQVLAVVGSGADIQDLGTLMNHPDARVPANVRSASFERGIKVKQ